MSPFSPYGGLVAETRPAAASLESPEETAEYLGPEMVDILADLYGQDTGEAERTLTLLRPGSLTTLEACRIVETKATEGGYKVALTDHGRETIAWCHEHVGDGHGLLSPDEFERQLRDQAAAIED